MRERGGCCRLLLSMERETPRKWYLSGMLSREEQTNSTLTDINTSRHFPPKRSAGFAYPKPWVVWTARQMWMTRGNSGDVGCRSLSKDSWLMYLLYLYFPPMTFPWQLTPSNCLLFVLWLNGWLPATGLSFEGPSFRNEHQLNDLWLMLYQGT